MLHIPGCFPDQSEVSHVARTVSQPRLIVIVPVGNKHMFSVALVADVLAEANRVAGRQIYETHIHPVSGKTTSDIPHGASISESLARHISALFLVSDDLKPPVVERANQSLIQGLSRLSAIVCASGPAVTLLADMNVLNDKASAGPFSLLSSLSERYPRIEFLRKVFHREGRYWTCAGGVHASRLALELLAADEGVEFSQNVASRLFIDTSPKSSEMLSVSAQFGFRNARLASAIILMNNRLEDGMALPEIARLVKISSRQLERLFRKNLNTTPHKFMQNLKLDRGRELLKNSDLSITEISYASGFANAAHFSKCYRLRFGVSPGYVDRNSLSTRISILTTGINGQLSHKASSSRSAFCPNSVEPRSQHSNSMPL